MGGGTGMPMAPIGMGIKPSRGGDGTNSGDGWTGSRIGGAGGFSPLPWSAGARQAQQQPRSGFVAGLAARWGHAVCVFVWARLRVLAFAEASRVLALSSAVWFRSNYCF